MEKILVLDFGGQYNMLIARRVREAHVYAEIKPYNKITAEQIAAEGYAGIIFTGGPNSVYKEESPHFDPAVLRLGIPVLGICYGHQLIAWMEGGEVGPAGDVSEYGKVKLYIKTYKKSPLFAETCEESDCWMSHTDQVVTPPAGFEITASTFSCKCAAMCDESRHIYGVQFHPEVTHTLFGRRMIENFIFRVCGCKGEWRMDDYAKTCVEKYRAELAGKRVLCALSGGVDSTVAAVMMHKAIGDNLVCVFVDHGLLRMAEGDTVERTFRETFNMNIIRVNAADRFLARLAGVTDPEQKRKIIGEEFIRVFEDESERLGKLDVLVQGTIYPDVIESGKGDASVIKSHHNVGGLPDVINFERIVEPLRDLFKDEVRAVGEQLGIPSKLVWRQPFPGPGLAIRVLGEVTREKLYTLRGADAIFREELEDYFHGHAISQYFAVLSDSRSVGVLGDERAYGRTIVLRAVTTDDFMTANWVKLPYDLLEKVSSRITNEVKGVTRVVYDVTSKPPATVEWE